MSTPTNSALQKSMQLIQQAQLLTQEKSFTKAVQAYQQAIRACPDNGLAYGAFIEMLIDLKEYANGLKVIQAIPTNLYQQSWVLKEKHGTLLCCLEQHQESLSLLTATLAANPDMKSNRLHTIIGMCHDGLKNTDQALSHYRKALSSGEESPALFLCLTELLRRTGDIKGTRHFYEIATRKFPDDKEVTFEYANFLLADACLEKGFHLYKQRFESASFGTKRANLPIPLWDGKKNARSLLVITEQGVGDLVLFSSFLPALAKKAGKLTLVCHAKLIPLFSRSFPDIHLIATGSSFSSDEFDAHMYAADAGAHALDIIGWKKGHLLADTPRADTLREKYRQQFPGKALVGFSWKSTRQGIDGEGRSTDMAAWLPVLENPACQFINLQYGDIDEDLRAAKALGINIHHDPDIDCFNDLDGLAAQMQALDLVISVTNTTAHLAAATHTPTWITVPMGRSLFWCWGLRGKTVFYPDACLFRAKKPDEWAPVIKEIAEALAQKLAS